MILQRTSFPRTRIEGGGRTTTPFKDMTVYDRCRSTEVCGSSDNLKETLTVNLQRSSFLRTWIEGGGRTTTPIADVPVALMPSFYDVTLLSGIHGTAV